MLAGECKNIGFINYGVDHILDSISMIESDFRKQLVRILRPNDDDDGDESSIERKVCLAYGLMICK
jgi:hypothetical protein